MMLRRGISVAALTLVASLLPVIALAQPILRPVTMPIQDYIAQIRINGALTSLTVPVVRVDGLGWLMDLEDFTRLKLVNLKPVMAQRGEQALVSLDRTRGIAILFNERSLELDITAGVSQFERSVVQGTSATVAPTLLKAWGGYVNYDASIARVRDGGLDSPSESTNLLPSAAGTIEAVVFSPHGSFVHQELFSRDLNGNNIRSRLDSFFQHDFPERGLRLRIGDNVSSSGSWGRAVRFGGVKLGSDFSLRPDLVTLPGVNISSASAVPSTVDVFVNGNLQGRYNLPAGQFSVDRVPLITGSGTVRMVVRNVLGAEQTIEVPFFRTASQLGKGISDFSVEAGVLRERYATFDDAYTERVAIANWRYGVNDELTGELRAEYSKRLQVAGAGVTFPFWGAHSLSPAVVASRSFNGERGWSALLGYSFSGQAMRFAARLERSSVNFHQLGDDQTRLSPTQRLALSGGYRIARDVDFGLAYTSIRERDNTSQSITSLNFSLKPTREIIVSGALSRVVVGTVTNLQAASTQASIQVYWSGEKLLYGSVTAQQTREVSRNSNYEVARIGSRLDGSAGLAWELEAAANARFRAKANYLGYAGQVAVEHQQLGSNNNSQRLSATGAIVVAGGSLVPARTIEDSFILVQADPDTKASIIRPGGRTESLDSNGNIVLSRVQPYRDNTIRVSAEKLDLDVTLEKSTLKAAVPARAGGVVQLGVKRSKPVTFTLIFAGKPIALGANLTVNGQKVLVGEQGLVYLPDAQPRNEIKAQFGSQQCTAILTTIKLEAMADLGVVTCR